MGDCNLSQESNHSLQLLITGRLSSERCQFSLPEYIIEGINNLKQPNQSLQGKLNYDQTS